MRYQGTQWQHKSNSPRCHIPHGITAGSGKSTLFLLYPPRTHVHHPRHRSRDVPLRRLPSKNNQRWETAERMKNLADTSTSGDPNGIAQLRKLCDFQLKWMHHLQRRWDVLLQMARDFDKSVTFRRLRPVWHDRVHGGHRGRGMATCKRTYGPMRERWCTRNPTRTKRLNFFANSFAVDDNDFATRAQNDPRQNSKAENEPTTLEWIETRGNSKKKVIASGQSELETVNVNPSAGVGPAKDTYSQWWQKTHQLAAKMGTPQQKQTQQ